MYSACFLNSFGLASACSELQEVRSSRSSGKHGKLEFCNHCAEHAKTNIVPPLHGPIQYRQALLAPVIDTADLWTNFKNKLKSLRA